jgi:Amidase
MDGTRLGARNSRGTSASGRCRRWNWWEVSEKDRAARPVIKSWISVDAEESRRTAAVRGAEVRDGTIRGALHGVPVALKDIYQGRHDDSGRSGFLRP